MAQETEAQPPTRPLAQFLAELLLEMPGGFLKGDRERAEACSTRSGKWWGWWPTFIINSTCSGQLSKWEHCSAHQRPGQSHMVPFDGLTQRCAGGGWAALQPPCSRATLCYHPPELAPRWDGTAYSTQRLGLVFSTSESIFIAITM